uniref:Glucokinase (hexokinase 4) regulator n=1 Tax=Scleropages formosus TaxID=113540 RepID=A0A8C9S030_SCLFO
MSETACSKQGRGKPEPNPALVEHEPYLPVTERSNPLTRDIDRADSEHIVHLLKACDAEIFHRDWGRLLNQQVEYDPEESLVVISGCGTSGRLAFLLAVTTELTKTDAPFIAGQLDFCINNLNVFTPAVVGFNLANMARNEPIPSWHLTFRQVIERMEELQKRKKAFIINPVVGPEAISGSSRLKGGSTTKIILETIFLGAHEAVSAYKRITAEDVMDRIRMYEQVHKITYSQSEMIASLVHLRKEGHVYYVGWSTLGIMGIIDASECIPTFGADAKDICGFINQGYNEMKNKDGDLTALGPEFCISHMDFVNTILPSVTELDTVIFLFTQDDGLCEIETLANRTKQRTSNLHAISHDLLGSEDLVSCVVKVMQELSTKWILNAVSTGGHILKGKIFRNYMMDLKVTNSKLFKRAVNILQMITGCLPTVCIRALLQAVYDTEDVTDDMTAAEVTKHTTLAPTRSRVKIVRFNTEVLGLVCKVCYCLYMQFQ